MKKTEEIKNTYEFRLEEILKVLLQNQSASVDYDTATMHTKDGGTVLVLEVNKIEVSK